MVSVTRLRKVCLLQTRIKEVPDVRVAVVSQVIGIASRAVKAGSVPAALMSVGINA